MKYLTPMASMTSLIGNIELEYWTESKVDIRYCIEGHGKDLKAQIL